jgi:hypothetical protein
MVAIIIGLLALANDYYATHRRPATTATPGAAPANVSAATTVTPPKK